MLVPYVAKHIAHSYSLSMNLEHLLRYIRRELTAPIALTERELITFRLKASYGCNLHNIVNMFCVVLQGIRSCGWFA